MGGSAFSAGTYSGDKSLYTPRMPKDVYETSKSQLSNILRELFHRVESPIDGPGKTDFGDIDIMVTSPLTTYASGREGLLDIARVLNTKEFIIEGDSNCSAHYAIPWPAQSTIQDDDPRERHIQVDVRICEVANSMDWMLFRNGHGDIWSILGSIIKPFGLTVTDKAMWLRIPEMEYVNRNQARVFLTSDTTQALHFLGLSVDEFYNGPFQDLQSMYNYASGCRMMCVYPNAREEHPRTMTKNRKRAEQRPAYKTWLEEFIPQCREAGKFSNNHLTRDSISKEALELFGAEKDYNSRREEFLVKQQHDHIWNNIIQSRFPKPAPSDHLASLHRTCLFKALKRIVLEGDASYGDFNTESLKDGQGFFIMDKVADFISTHHKQIGELAMERHHSSCDKNMLKLKSKHT